jgi:thymidylate kinase
MPTDPVASLSGFPVIVLDGCDGAGKSTLAEDLARRYGHAIIHSGRTPDNTDLAVRYRTMLTTSGQLVLDRSFISELVYGPLDHGRSRLTASEALILARHVAARGGVLVHLTGHPALLAARLRTRDGNAPSANRIRTIVSAYHHVFAELDGSAPIITIDASAPSPAA